MLSDRGKWLRREIFRLSKENGGYHYGGSLSCCEILLTLFDHILGIVDRFLLSKGHGCWGYYALLIERGYRPVLEGHPHLDLANNIPFTTGSLGHGLPAALGMALARKIQNRPGRIFVLISDGECQEGTTWESMLLAVQHELDNLIVIVDNNGIQGSGYTDEILSVRCLDKVAAAIGWEVDYVDGHDEGVLKHVLSSSQAHPRMIIASTVKGRGISFMEDEPRWHACFPDAEQTSEALKELNREVEVR